MEKPAVRKLRFISSIRTKFALVYFAVVVVVLLLLNTYFLIASRNMIFSFKEDFAQSQAALIGNHLGDELETLAVEDGERVFEIVSPLDIAVGTKIVVTDAEAEIVYDPGGRATRADFPIADIRETLRSGPVGVGHNIVYASFSEGVFVTSAFTPIVRYGAVIGAVYLHDEDVGQGEMLLEMQSTIMNISISVTIFSIVLVTLLIWSVMRRVRSIMYAIESVREGEYSYQISMRGRDELAVLGDEFNSLTSRLRETEEVRRRFVADASHELKTPLASIRLLSDSILQNKNIRLEVIHEFIEDIGLEAERLSRTTDKLMTLTRLDSQIADKLVQVDMKDAVIATLRMLKPLAESMNVSLISDLSDGCYILGTEDSVHQIIFNLIENAIKYNKPNCNVRVGLSTVNKKVVLSVKDRGVGIPDEDIPHIFDRFYRVDKARSRDAGGSGLGLAIVDDTVRELNGKITVEKRTNGGMNFTVTFDLLANRE